MKQAIDLFYRCSSSFSSLGLSVTAEGLANDDEDLLVQGHYDGISFPVIFRQENDDSGEVLSDILDTGWPSLYLISKKIRNILQDNLFTGWTTFSVKVFNKEGNEIKDYYGLSIIGKCGSIDYSKSTITTKKISPDLPSEKYYIGLYIGLDQWDESDIFLPKGSSHIIVSKKLKKELIKGKSSNIEFINLAEIETAEYGII